MILILSQNFEPSTDFVIEWLRYLNKPFYRVNYDSDLVEAITMELANEDDTDRPSYDDKYNPGNHIKKFTFQLRNGTLIDLKSVTSIWYRRGGMPDFNEFSLDFSVLKNKFFIEKAKRYVRTEYNEIIRYMYYFLFQNPGIKTIGNPMLTGSSKLTYLTMARMHGLKIPDFYIVSKKEDLAEIVDKVKYKITKGISEMVMFAQDYFKLVSYTANIEAEDLEKVENKFFPSGVQRKIIKLADIRVVYFGDEFYSMAIFSQKNPKTSTDFRNYDPVNPNRNTPFQLPKDFETKLRALCKYINIDFCSIDVLLDENYDFYFLEINPVGQFGMTSMPCNYYIEQKIAQYL